MINMILLSAMFLTLFAVGELAYYFGKIQAEFTRKFVHIGTGILTMLFPVMLTSHWFVLALCSSFLLILTLSLKFGLLPSINAIDRKSNGSILYPIIVYCTFLFYEWQHSEKIYFYLPILTMAFCDPMAAIIGKKYGVKKYHFGTDTKSYIGSLAFMLTSIPLTMLCYWFTYSQFNTQLLVLCIVVAVASMSAEAVSTKGFDNFSIPATVATVLVFVL